MEDVLNVFNEVTLSRVWNHFKSDRAVVIMTGFRDEKSNKENIQANKAIASQLKNAGFGYVFVDGFWVENQGTADEVEVSEDSIFVTADASEKDKLIKLAHELANKYNQDAIFVKESKDNVYLLFKNGSKEKLSGGLKPDKVSQFYTKLRGRGNRTFVFESVKPSVTLYGKWSKNYKKD
ncbi:hypothetical protein [uncultured Arcobacter sp.]|uniref:hypothetical protein n=1 Tax=uncultured Arcobacter sp. TaxID=165434 RepID=UPI002629E5E2|nr:hypothetical protein [uncultured Arcobacter sp.]